MRAFAVPASVLVPLLLLGSCRPPAPVLGPLPSGAAVQRYDEALATWTRRSRAYRRMESRIIVSATCLSARFRAARDAEYVRLFGASPQELDAWRRGLEEAAAEHDV
ncbi:MAG: hypothetical protein FJ098_12860, partial [Deltaproteobacteria bacterium]|nr:hypothetical protein [Deltaproteobacteria bacterium]